MKKFFLVGIVVISSLVSHAQYTREDSPTPADKQPAPTTQNAPSSGYDFWKHVSIGGGLGLQFGDYTIISCSPLFNYHFDKSFVLGIGPIYQYISITDPTGYYPTYRSSIYGGRIRAIYFLPGSLANLFLIGEYDILNVPDPYSIFTNETRATVPIPLFGIGLRRPISENSYLSLEALWDFSGSALSPYTNPLIIGGIDIGI
jgi:hypothetical protein